MTVRILMYSWEFPPKSVGGLARHVHDLSLAMAQQGHEIQVVTCGGDNLPAYENIKGVEVYRVQPYYLRAPNFRTWILQLNLAMLEFTMTLRDSQSAPWDIVHCHDWLTAYVSRAVKHAQNIPLVATIHATEFGRNWGLHDDNQRYISDVEWWLTYEAWRVIVCSQYMHNEVRYIFSLPEDKIRIIPNGVRPEDFQTEPEPGFRNQYAHPTEKIVFFVGRLVHEKGAHILLEAIPKILHYHPQTKFVIAGRGPAEGYLRQKAWEIGIGERIYFTGYIDDLTRNKLYRSAEVAVFPSLYEPFGIVALEAMAARTPVVVSDTGGLGEIIKHGINGLKCYVGSPNSLADNVLKVLCDPPFARQVEERAYREVLEIYNWDIIARTTIEVYQEILAEQ